MVGCAAQNNDSGCQNIDAAQLKAMLDSDPSLVLVDVREPDEFSSGHLAGAINIPVGEIESQTDQLPKDLSGIIVYCRSGRRSAAAAGLLIKQGYENVYNLSGGIIKWPYKIVK